MLKFTRHTAALGAFALIASTPQLAHARPLSAISDYPVVPRNQTNSLMCYMRTQKGALLNLGRLCGDNTSTNNTILIPKRRSIPRRVLSTRGGYGAIAFSPSTKQFGYIGPQLTRVAAEAQAKKMCGQKDCKVGLSFRNTCGAFALKGNNAIYAQAGSDADARRAVLLKAGKGGKLIVGFCSK